MQQQKIDTRRCAFKNFTSSLVPSLLPIYYKISSLCLLFSNQTPKMNTAKDNELKSLILSKIKQFFPLICSLSYFGHRYGKLNNTEALELWPPQLNVLFLDITMM